MTQWKQKVPIIPEYLFELDHPNETAEVDALLSSRNITAEQEAIVVAENWKKVQMNRLNIQVGLMFASKPVVQMIANPFIGPLTNKLAALSHLLIYQIQLFSMYWV